MNLQFARGRVTLSPAGVQGAGELATVSPTLGGFTPTGVEGTAELSVPTLTTGSAVATANPLALPVAVSTQTQPSVGTYTALTYYNAADVAQGTNPRNMPVGTYYLDPTSGLKVWRLTSATQPQPATAYLNGPDYAEGGLRVGRPTGTVYPLLINAWNGGTPGWHVDTFDIATGAVTKRCTAPGAGGGAGEGTKGFSYTTPNVLYVTDGAFLRKYDVSGATAVEIVSAPFPKNLSAYLHGQSAFYWFSSSLDDRWFCLMAGSGGPWVVGFDAQTDTVYEKQVTGIDEPKMDKGGRYVWCQGSTPYTLDFVTGSLRTISGSAPAYRGHAGVGVGYAFSNPNDGRAEWALDLRTETPSWTYPGTAFNLDNMYAHGGWVDQPAGYSTAQWTAIAYQTGGSSEPSPVLYRYGAIGIRKLDGTDNRFLCHAMNAGNINTTAEYYGNTIWPNFAPDGRFVMFKSNGFQSATIGYAFAAILPTS